MTEAADLSGVTIAVARASTQDTGVTAVAPADAQIRRFDDDASAVQALMSRQVQTIGLSNVVFSQISGVAGGRFDKKFDLSSQLQGIAVSPDSDALLAEINSFVTHSRTDGTPPAAPMARSTRCIRPGWASRCPISSRTPNNLDAAGPSGRLFIQGIAT
ncbi:hypothetical protein [Ketogulonicigenium vulgare]|uniref:hypothetical protein n=1 Tax=Ketogulonicigenium vulgare TaxID=92945 RepID=UPI003F5CC298